MTNDPNHPRSEDLFAYRDGELPPERRAVIEAHVMGCSSCRALIDQVSSLEAELRRSPDRSPAEYLEHLHESVRARIAVSKDEEAPDPVEVTEEVRPGGARVGRDPGVRRSRRSLLGGDEAGEEGRIKGPPGLPWAAVLSTAGAAAAVLVVVVVLVRQGTYQRAIAPIPAKVSEIRAGAKPAAPGESTAAVGRQATNARGGRAAGSTQGAGTADKLAANLPSPAEAKKARAKDRLAKRELKMGNEAAERTGEGRIVLREEREMAQKAAPPAASTAPESEDQAAVSRFRADQEPEAGSEYEDVLRRYGLPPVWNAQVTPEKLERAEPE